MSAPESNISSKWPTGLWIIFWLALIDLLAGTCVLAYKLFISHDFSLLPENAWQWAVVGVQFFGELIAVFAGLLKRRVLFGTTAFISAVAAVGVTSYFNAEMFGMFLHDLRGGNARYWFSWNTNALIYHWNLFVILVNAVIGFYLLRAELYPLWSHRFDN